MNARHLLREDGSRACVAQCGKCNRLWDVGYAPVAGGRHGDRPWTLEERYEYTFEQAERCCNWRCNQCSEPAFSQFQQICRRHLDEQSAKESAEREAKAFTKAKPHPSPEDCKLILGERVYDGLDDLLGCCDADELPEYVWCAKPMPLALDADRIIENATEDMHESARDQIEKSDVEELQEFLDGWCSRFPVVSYDTDYTQYVLITKTVGASDDSHSS